MEPEERAVAEVIQVRLRVLLALKKWDEAIVIGKGAIWFLPSYGEFYFLTAQAQRSTDRIDAARETLLRGEHVLAKDAQWNFELAHCECLLGHLEAAKQRLKRAFILDPKLRVAALDADSLKPLWQAL